MKNMISIFIDRPAGINRLGTSHLGEFRFIGLAINRESEE